MIKRTLLSLLLICILSSCASTFGIVSLGSKMKQLEIGMTKAETLSILGNTYDVIAASQTPDGKLEVLRFVGMNSGFYTIYLLDSKLVEWHEGSPREDRPDRIIIRDPN